MKIRTANEEAFGINFETADFGPAATWLNLIERATLELGLAHPDELDHLHAAYPGGEDVDHASLNWEEDTVDFDCVHRYPMTAVLPSQYASYSLDIEHA